MSIRAWFHASNPAQISLRTYLLASAFSLGPAVVPISRALVKKSKGPASPTAILARVLARELHVTGFAFAMTVSVGGGAWLRALWSSMDRKHIDRLHTYSSRLSPMQKTFISNLLSSAISFQLLQAARRRTQFRPRRNSPSATLDFTLLLFVRAVDVFIQSYVFRRSLSPSIKLKVYNETSTDGLVADLSAVRERLEREEQQKDSDERARQRASLRTKIDAILFWACSARIMWCFFYHPNRLPPSYQNWISRLAELDNRLLATIRNIRTGDWSYRRGSASHSHVLQGYATSLGYPAVWGDPSALPPVGGDTAVAIWKDIGVSHRNTLGGVPCELVHGVAGQRWGLAASCTANTLFRGIKTFLRALIIYLPAHFIPILLTRPNTLMNAHKFVSTVFGALRSSAFLSTFVASFWYTVCFTRTLAIARIFPQITHDFYDGPWGAILAGCLICGNSIWIENGRRRGEMALYVLPKAVRSCLPLRWLRSGNRAVQVGERLTFMLSISSLLTAAAHHPDALRGLSRWTLAFIMKGPRTGLWKRKKMPESIPLTPAEPQTPQVTDARSVTPLPLV